ncbi:dihydrolipoyllysine-residue acetyltransferase [Legionella londiniensis]|uniref:Acetyltransferase component of pyruvate dehydrogenase complex n=1 Tax=Legionella londiniensis TaxID=45068 RepID=A0A0W0VNK7_9GAMM|nr:dihydrolipoyllysine-residue acetyltransferase [Legionella londiniensis]KTD21671.1 Pyruvate dehydrogenase (dihydrolipoyltransacetylase component) E2p [Legionella londiniensis]STX93494.1 Pyruvate dehydrogenase (dihydrolipoyltransacetylase component) E2p [Legionella londiniensis]
MANLKEIKIPDIGGATDVDVIEILVKEGDEIEQDTPLITLESDKASMDIPAPESGIVKDIKLKVGDKVSEGDIILTLANEAGYQPETSAEKENEQSGNKTHVEKHPGKTETVKDKVTSEPKEKSVKVPDIGGASNVDVIEVLVSEGEEIEKDTPLITLESDKASMDIPSPYSGKVRSIRIKVGDKVAEGDEILTLLTIENVSQAQQKREVQEEKQAKKESLPQKEARGPAKEPETRVTEPAQPFSSATLEEAAIPAGPAVRRIAHEFGINLAEVRGTGRKSRITTEDVQNYVKTKLQEKTAKGPVALPAAPKIDFSQFGEIETRPLNKIKRLTGVNVHRSWITIPHVTQFDEADITDLESFRNSQAEEAKKAGFKLTLLAFVCKVVGKALTVYPQFNSSLDESGENLIFKKYVNIGVAVETPNGLVVPVIKEINRLTVSEIAQEMGRLSNKAREKGLMPADMSGGCFTISSLGGIGGTAFTPIVNSPEVAILGLSRSLMKPVFKDGAFIPRLMLPLSLSYDHRVIDGAEAARFTRYISDSLGDIRKVLL